MDLVKSSDKSLVMSCHALWNKLSKSSLRLNRVVIVVSSMKLYKFLLDPAVFNLINTDNKLRRGSYLLLMSDSNRHFQDLRSGFYLGVYNQSITRGTEHLQSQPLSSTSCLVGQAPHSILSLSAQGRGVMHIPQAPQVCIHFPPPAGCFLVKQGPSPSIHSRYLGNRTVPLQCSIPSMQVSRHDVIR